MTIEEMAAAVDVVFRAAVGRPAEVVPTLVTAQLWQIAVVPPAADITEQQFEQDFAQPIGSALAVMGLTDLGLTHFTEVTARIKARRPGVQPTFTAVVRGW